MYWYSANIASGVHKMAQDLILPSQKLKKRNGDIRVRRIKSCVIFFEPYNAF